MTEALRAIMAKTWDVMVEQIAGIFPKVIAGILILALGVLIARLIRGITARFLVAVRLDRLADRLHVGDFLARGDVRFTAAEILATTIYWLVLLFCLQVLGGVLGLDAMANFFAQVLGYVPRIIGALLIVVAGLFVGSFLGSAVRVAASNAGFPAPAPLGQAVKFLVAFFAFVMALQQVDIPAQLLVGTLLIVVAATALGLALAFGLGGRALAEESLRAWAKKSKKNQPAEEKPADS